MRPIFFLHTDSQDLTPALTCQDQGLLVVLPMDPERPAGEAERELERRQSLAERVRQTRTAKGLDCDVRVEWGAVSQVRQLVLDREEGRPLA